MNTAARASARRTSVESNPGSNNRQTSQSRIPMGPSRSAANRLASTQPSYDFISGSGTGDSPPRQGARRMSISKAPIRAGSRPPSRSENRPPDGLGEDLRAQVRSLQFERDALKQERDMTKLRHEKEMRDMSVKHEAELRNAKVVDSSAYIPAGKHEALVKELASARDAGTSRSGDLEKKLRSLQEENRTLKEEVEEVQAELGSQSRGTRRQLEEVETKHAKLVQTLNDLRHDLDSKDSALKTSQQKLSDREADLGALEAENVRLRASGGDQEELAMMKRELSEQLTQTRKLETTNREQLAELRRLRDQAKSVGVIQEEKKVLEIQVERMDRLEHELGEAKFQRQLLEDERSAWKSYLQSAVTGDEMDFESPEAMAKALTSERLERATLFDKLGQLQPELTAREAEVSSLRSEIEKLKDSSKVPTVEPAAKPMTESKALARLERQKILAQKEIEYLKAQLKTFETEDTTNLDLDSAPHSVDAATKAKIGTLEELVTQYRSELDKVNKELDSANPTASTEKQPLKRPSPSPEESERLSVLTRKLQTLQHTLSKAESSNRSLSSELSATKIQLTQHQSTSRTRILSLRENPTDTFSREVASTIAILRQENSDLHTQLASPTSTTTSKSKPDSNSKVVPISYLSSARSEIQTLRTQLSSSEKRLTRLREIWSSKSLEFRAAVASLLGWRMDFLPGGKFRLTSLFNTSATDKGKPEDERIWDTSFIFDGESGTMKVAGGEGGQLAKQVRGLVEYWVRDRKEIPGFLAACTMEWVERTEREGVD